MIIQDICEAKLSKLPRLVTVLGNFDGVHLAHTELIRKTKEIASLLCTTAGETFLTAVFTFYDLKKPFITSTQEKLEIFRELGIDYIFLCPFEQIRSMSPEEFVSEILVSKIGCSHAVCGFNYRFGKGASADAEELSRLGKKYGFDCTVMPEMKGVSSTRIRSLLSEGNIESANKLLGRPFSLSGEIIHGKGLGHTLGCPTVNISIPDGKVRLLNGVYFTLCKIEDEIFPSITNIGVCPTFETNTLVCENHLLDTKRELYGKTAEVTFLAFRRPEIKFSSTEELYREIDRDIHEAKKFHFGFKI